MLTAYFGDEEEDEAERDKYLDTKKGRMSCGRKERRERK